LASGLLTSDITFILLHVQKGKIERIDFGFVNTSFDNKLKNCITFLDLDFSMNTDDSKSSAAYLSQSDAICTLSGSSVSDDMPFILQDTEITPQSTNVGGIFFTYFCLVMLRFFTLFLCLMVVFLYLSGSSLVVQRCCI